MNLGFFITREIFNSLIKRWYPDENVQDGLVVVVDQDDQYVMGYFKYHHGHAKYNLLIGEKLDRNKHDLARFTDLWIDRYGNAYYVPVEGHYLTACLLGYQGADALEEEGWVHISGGTFWAFYDVKYTDRQYDTVADYCAAHKRPIFSRFINMC